MKGKSWIISLAIFFRQDVLFFFFFLFCTTMYDYDEEGGSIEESIKVPM